MLTRAIGVAVLALTCAWGVSAAQQNEKEPAPQGQGEQSIAAMPSMRALQQARGIGFDIAFLSEMTAHHQGAIEMSEHALANARNEQVKQAARKVIDSQKKESAQLTAWLREWYRRAPDPRQVAQMRTDMAPMMAAFRRDCQANCDRAFLKHMSDHHQMGLYMARMATEKAARGELKRMAETMVQAQHAEIAQFSQWLQAGIGGSPSPR